MPLKVKAEGRSDRGLVRPGNEDFLHLDPTNQIYAVCDGMGGHQAGEVASMTAADTVQKSFERFSDQLLADSKLKLPVGLPASADLLLKSIRLANRAIYTRAGRDSSLAGMGTTIVAVAFEGDICTVAHVGDSRAYRLDENELVPLTVDHSWLSEMQKQHNLSREEASSVVGKNIITRALGVRPTVDVDFQILKIKPGDVFLLCSDGLCGFADDDEIFHVARKRRDDLSALVEDLVRMANDRGGADNVTVIAARIIDIGQPTVAGREVDTLNSEGAEQLEAEDLWLQRLAARPQDETAPKGKKGGSWWRK